MSPLQERLLAYLPDPNTVKGGLNGVVDTLSTEAPLLVADIMRWHVWYNALWCIASALFIVMVLCFLPKMRRYALECEVTLAESGNTVDGGVPIVVYGCVLPTILIGIPFVIFVCHLGWLQPLIAPRLFLLEYLKGLM